MHPERRSHGGLAQRPRCGRNAVAAAVFAPQLPLAAQPAGLSCAPTAWRRPDPSESCCFSYSLESATGNLSLLLIARGQRRESRGCRSLCWRPQYRILMGFLPDSTCRTWALPLRDGTLRGSSVYRVYGRNLPAILCTRVCTAIRETKDAASLLDCCADLSDTRDGQRAVV